MNDLDNQYVYQVMSTYFDRILLLFGEIYGKAKVENIEGSDIEDSTETELPDVTELLYVVRRHLREYPMSSFLSKGNVYLHDNPEIETKVKGALHRIGRDISREVPILFTDSDKKSYTNILVTNKRIYWFNGERPKDSINISDIKALSIKGKFVFAKPLAEMTDGTVKELPEIDLYLGECKSYVEMLNMVLNIFQK